MSIFNNVKPTKKNPELELLIKLKYGEPKLTSEFLESLPEAVIREASRLVTTRYAQLRTPDVITQRQVLSIMYRQPSNQKQAIQAVEDALYNYHLLFP
jgi:hypothetical protein